jgi:small subunit ribosomal protein S21
MWGVVTPLRVFVEAGSTEFSRPRPGQTPAHITGEQSYLKAVYSAHAIKGATILVDPAAKLEVAHFETSRGKHLLQVLVRDNNVDQALRVLKKKMQREGVFREMKRRRFYEKPSEKTAREKGEAIRRARKLARKRAQREGLIAAPRKKEPGIGKTGGQQRSPTNR